MSSDKSRRTYDGIIFDSEMEMRYYRDVVLPMLQSGEIYAYDLQKKFELQPKFKSNGKTIRAIDYVADFVLYFADGHLEVIDTKGFPDSVSQLKRKMFLYKYPDLIYRWITYSKIDGGWCDYELVKKARVARKK